MPIYDLIKNLLEGLCVVKGLFTICGGVVVDKAML